MVVVLALLWLGTPNHRKVERYRLPQALQSICRGLDWCQRLLQPPFRRASLRPVLPASWSSLRCSPSRTSRALRTPFVCFASFLPPSKNRKFSAQPMTRRRSCQVNFGSFAPASSLWETIDLSKFWSNFAWLFHISCNQSETVPGRLACLQADLESIPQCDPGSSLNNSANGSQKYSARTLLPSLEPE